MEQCDNECAHSSFLKCLLVSTPWILHPATVDLLG